MTPHEELVRAQQRRHDKKMIGGILLVGLFAFLFFNAAPFFETVHTINQVTRVAPAVIKETASAFDKYEKEMKERKADALRYLSLTPHKVTADSMGVKVLWKIENKSGREYRTAVWDCTAFFNDEPVGTHMVMNHYIPADRPTYDPDSFSFREYDPSFKYTDPSAFRFECRMIPGLSYSEKEGE
jgi:hypothetical protein